MRFCILRDMLAMKKIMTGDNRIGELCEEGRKENVPNVIRKGEYWTDDWNCLENTRNKTKCYIC